MAIAGELNTCLSQTGIVSIRKKSVDIVKLNIPTNQTNKIDLSFHLRQTEKVG